MKRLLLASAALVAASPAMAAGVDPWVGLYVGGNFGYSWGTLNTTTSVAPFTFNSGPPLFASFAFPGGASSTSLNLDGAIGGGQAGYVWRIAPDWLAGIEADYEWSGEKASGFGGFSGAPPCTIDSTLAVCSSSDITDITARLSWFGTLRFRAGYESNGLWFYGTLGPAFGTVVVSGTHTLSVSGSFFGGAPVFTYTASTPFSYSTTKGGASAGVGVEGLIGTSNHWRWKAEYLFVDLGSIGGGTFGGITVNSGIFTDNIIRFGVNYNFGT
jgi:outer membrane immunogenic protein